MSTKFEEVRPQCFSSPFTILWIAIAFTLLPVTLPAQSSGTPSIMLGDAWYPEQWPESRWEADLSLMQQAHLHVVRVGEFAWSSLEPNEGDYRLDWLERAINLAGKHGIYTVLGTPTAAPPAWLTQKYPETLRVDIKGHRDQHGGRQQFNFTNPKYRLMARLIARQMAIRFGHNPYVIGWQIDNEIGEASYDDGTRQLFRIWLQRKYGTLDHLNTAWTTTYWSQTYSSWSQILIPVRDGYETGNPGLRLNWRLFVSDTWKSYLKNQIDAIRPFVDKREWMTTNTIGYQDPYDLYITAPALDIAAWDNYMGDGRLNIVRNGFAHDMARGFKQKNFWVMETQPGFVNWAAKNISLQPGVERALIWHDIAHGADAVCFWQWRSAFNGQEQYHGVLVGTDGTPVPIYDEIQKTGAEIDKVAHLLTGTAPHSEVAMLYSYESRWAIEWQRHTTEFDPVEQLDRYYGPLRRATQSVDVLSPDDDISGCKLVIAPALNLITATQADRLARYVKAGGNLVLTARSGMKDGNNSLWPQRQPGPLAELLGGRVDQFYVLDQPVSIQGPMTNAHAQASVWAEALSTSSSETKVLLSYGDGNGWLTGHPAVVQRKIGTGSISYVGAVLDNDTTASLVNLLVHQSGASAPEIRAPIGIEASTRYGAIEKVHILINVSGKAQTIQLPVMMRDELNDVSVQKIEIPVNGVAVLSEPR